MSDQGEALRAQAEQELQARVNQLVNNLPSGYGTPARVWHAAREAAIHYGYKGAVRQRFADLAVARWQVRIAEDEQTRQEAPATNVAPSPAYRPGDLVTVWLGRISPCNAIIRRPDFLGEGEWWYLCSMSGMFGAEHFATIPEGWIKRPGEAPPVPAYKQTQS